MMFIILFVRNGCDFLVELSFFQLISLCQSVVDFCKENRLSDRDLASMRVLIRDPSSGAVSSFDIFFP